MNIPGYYFDKHKKRYFKITNGSMTNSYHNNEIQQMERHKQIQEYHQDLESPKINANQANGYKLLYFNESPSNIKLGLCRTNPTTMEYERLNSLAFVDDVYYGNLEVKLWDKIIINDEIYIIITNQIKQFQLLNIQQVLRNLKLGKPNSRPESTSSESESTDYLDMVIDFNDGGILNDAINSLNLLPFDYLTISRFKNLIFYNLISESDLDNPQIYQNFIKIIVLAKRGNSFIKSDKSFVMFKFLKNLTSGEIKKDLLHLFGMNLIELNPTTYSYKTIVPRPQNRFFITFSKFIDNYLILGTNLGIIYLIKYHYDKDQLSFFDDIIKFKFDTTIKLDKITQIDKVQQYLFISSFKKLIILNIENNEKFSYSNNELIKNFKVLRILQHFKIVFISYKKILVLTFDTRSHKFNVLNQYDLINDNLINLFSIITIKNNLVLNQSNNSLLVIDLSTLKSKIVTLDNPNQRINGLLRLNENYLLINFKNSDNTSYFSFYQI